MIIIGFESSCDETGVALVCTERGLLAHALHSQIAMHREYGGVVPELASRDHIRRILPLTRAVLNQAGLPMERIDAVAYTAGPGLAGALLVGASVAQAFAWARGLPAIPIHHLEGHLLSPLLATPRPEFPFVALLVSGGHTQIMRVGGVGDYELLGETLDDAAGEAFDKSAKLLGLGYPGGPALSKLAQEGDAGRYELPRPMLHSRDLDFSFSGLKTAVLTRLRAIEKESGALDDAQRADLAAATESAIVDVLAAKAIKAVKQTGLKRLVVAGGVGANRHLRKQLIEAAARLKCEVFFPPLDLCTDNGAMIAFAAAMRVNAGLAALDSAGHAFTVRPRWDLEDICGPAAAPA
ncbi:tRNA (adenosine(37)-N6)-threonylcarbamoyltransferase complex transferase subunit TsaD [Parapusillimonas granuli]|uniref:tRNA N6-adenosine threonylcarbamoyltransferase n=1 Tax=Parapusillimonas granuli TaxID=380911 RepID=A0A853G2F4_9BURK|nr:tRNA (adenosine(37)-N6)-threonylcarbamoyltransferase complex transferase subunit TsaD [Parapusillimonas granuli]MBB5214058.1 N6-L-threonylcarbamoyladenine synthase [Parapusillimonas granuli]MEB2400907.1 tRNA (adenosine(37)-N6)-threonylcarbamoyltransferase complex transferase subunit TsaD [Alcaligenaceae bacterium]NYT50479.1 tRNA (adenosine(37)-N6)-threonylcarbamoyltransferase complex transferase subunit TsaD [Parapusillimonas granuli]